MTAYVFYNGRIHTMAFPDDLRRKENAMSWAHRVTDAILVIGSKIAAVGSNDQVLALSPPGADKVDLKGLAVYPGFHDSHIHFIEYSLGLREVDLHGVRTIEDALSIIKDKASLQQGGFLTGHGWDKSLFGRFPTRFELDSAVPCVPCILSSKDGHSVWVNTKALEMCSIEEHQEAPPGGSILRDEKGQILGVFQDKAQSLIYRAVPDKSPEEKFSALCDGVKDLWHFGITCVHVPDGLEMFPLARRLIDNAGLPMRFSVMPPIGSLDLLSSLGIKQGFGDDLVFMGQVKMFKDGSLGSSTALLYEPYEHIPGYVGLEVMPQEVLLENVAKCVKAGYGVAVHAIGDKAVSSTLDAIEASIEESSSMGLRHRIEHAQMVLDRDIQRFSQLSVIASVQPSHVVADRYMVEREWGHRAKRAYPFGRLKESGAILCLGSDAPVETPDVIFGIHSAVSRNLPGEDPEKEWHPKEKLLAEEAIKGYTADAAFACGKENVLGRLVPGAYADLVVLSQDPLLVPPKEIPGTRVLLTMVGGLPVFRDGDFQQKL